MDKNALAAVISFILIGMTAISCMTYYSIKKDEALKSSIESAITKGIDPMAVRCAYGATDTVCMIYAAARK